MQVLLQRGYIESPKYDFQVWLHMRNFPSSPHCIAVQASPVLAPLLQVKLIVRQSSLCVSVCAARAVLLKWQHLETTLYHFTRPEPKNMVQAYVSLLDEKPLIEVWQCKIAKHISPLQMPILELLRSGGQTVSKLASLVLSSFCPSKARHAFHVVICHLSLLRAADGASQTQSAHLPFSSPKPIAIPHKSIPHAQVSKMVGQQMILKDHVVPGGHKLVLVL